MTTRSSEKRQLVREELLRTSEQLCSTSDLSGLGLALRGRFPTLQHAFILDWVPEQAEDIYWVLIVPNEIAEVEVPRAQPGDGEPASLQQLDVATYRKKRHLRQVREKLEIALELICA